MKKTILLIAILSLVILFSGCDALLEGFFPTATGGGDKGEDAINAIEVGLYIESDIFNLPDYANCWVPVIIQLEIWDPGMGMWQPFERRDIWCSWDNYVYELFEWLPNGEYRVVVYYDTNVNGLIETIDPNVFAWDYNTGSEVLNACCGNWYFLDAYLYGSAQEVVW